jgi:hypothetical protein
MIRTMDGPSELWRMRKQFALQIASCSFMTYTLCLTHRTPYRYLLSRTTGQMTMTELVPGTFFHYFDVNRLLIVVQGCRSRYRYSQQTMSSHSV